MAFPCVREDGFPGNPETAALMCSIWVTREKHTQSLLEASKDMLSCDVGMTLLPSKKSCLLSPPLRFV